MVFTGNAKQLRQGQAHGEHTANAVKHVDLVIQPSVPLSHSVYSLVLVVLVQWCMIPLPARGHSFVIDFLQYILSFSL